MKLKPEDVHTLSIIALDPHGKYASPLLNTLDGKLLEVARGLRGEIALDQLEEDVRSAVEEFQHWANPSLREVVAA